MTNPTNPAALLATARALSVAEGIDLWAALARLAPSRNAAQGAVNILLASGGPEAAALRAG